MKVKIKNTSASELPAYQTAGAAGVDLRANLPEGVIRLVPLAHILMPTGLYLGIPDGYEAQAHPRSGLSVKHGITVISTPGTIDCDYRGEIKVPIISLSNETFEIAHNGGMAQTVFVRYEQASLEETSVLSGTERGAGGFGGTGN